MVKKFDFIEKIDKIIIGKYMDNLDIIIHKKLCDIWQKQQSKIIKPLVVDENICACFTGHRPQSLPLNDNKVTIEFANIAYKLKNLIIESINNGYTYFVSGLAHGIDLLSAEFILELKQEYPFIKLECAIPYITQSNSYSLIDKKRYLEVLENADVITIINKDYKRGCLFKRNNYMISKSSLLIGVWNGKKSGTSNTINYANKKGIPCKLIMF